MVNREDVTNELREAQTDFHRLIDRANPQSLRCPTDGTRWTNRQLLYHMVFGYIIVRTLMPLAHVLGRIGWSRRFAATLNALHRPFHIINYLGSCAGGQLLSPGRNGRSDECHHGRHPPKTRHGNRRQPRTDHALPHPVGSVLLALSVCSGPGVTSWVLGVVILTSRTAHRYTQPCPVGRYVISEVQTRSSCPVSHTRSTRSSGLARPSSGIVVTGVNFRGLMPCSRCHLIEAATIFLDTVSPPSRRSARIRGAPYTSSDALRNAAIFASRAARRTTDGLGAAPWAAAHL